MVGQSYPPDASRRLLPELCLLLAGGCALGSLTLLVLVPSQYSMPALLGLGAAVLIGWALWLEARLERRRFVLHFATETLRLERLSWAPSATRTDAVPFDDVTAVEVVQRPSGHYALVVVWKAGTEQEPEQRRTVLVEKIRPAEAQTLQRVWRMLHNAFGLKPLAPSAG